MKQGFLRDSKGKGSIMRLAFYTLVLGGLTFAYIYPDNHTGYLGILGIGSALKWAQKKEEVKK